MINLLYSINRALDGMSFGNVFGKIGIVASSMLAAIFIPIKALLISCFVFTFMDMIYGIRVAIKSKHKIESNKTWKGTLAKLLDEFSILSLARLLEYSVLGTEGVFVLTGGATVILCLTEFWSILENLNTLDPNGPWKALGKFLKKKGEEHIGFKLDLDGENNNMVTHTS
ncbi:phage holin family protein [Sharpea azabuensis]|uniref:phage holin family protein n=1 Tax=Sharpea azabuensis TaxID=322505 RepID=UPI001569009F|nr:phage holin family protein [Sharpea azabuensis]